MSARGDGELPDFAAAGLLDGLQGRARQAREHLLVRLHRDGVGLDELRRAVDEQRLALLPVERVLEGERRYTLRDVAERSGLPGDVLVAQWRASGLPVPDPDDRCLTESDLTAARISKQFLDAGISEDTLIASARVFGQAASRAAAAVRSAVRTSLTREGDTELDVALRFAAAGRELRGGSAALLTYAYEQHLQDQVRGDVLEHGSFAAGEPGDTHEVTVAFADLVGFTKLGQTVGPEDLGAVAGRLVELATDVVASPVRLVKTIGDAVMLVAPDPVPLIEATLRLVGAVDAEARAGDFPLLRAGIAAGRAVQRWDDWYGTPVNLAARVVGVARPSTVLATAPVRDAAREQFRWSRAGHRRLKGVREPVRLYRCRARTPPDAG